MSETLALDIEQVGNAIITALKAALPGKLAAMQVKWASHDVALYGHQVDLPSPSNTHGYHYGDTLQIAEFPAVIVDPQETAMQSRPYRGDAMVLPATHKFVIDLYIADDDGEQAARQMSRYGVALVEVLQEDPCLDDLVRGGAVQAIYYGRGATEYAAFRFIQVACEFSALSND